MRELEKRTWAEISLDNLRHNVQAIRAALPEGCRFLGVVKANAYGHGSRQVSRTLAACGADYLAVSCLDEAMELRDGGVSLPILILGHTPVEYTRLLTENDFTQTVTSLEAAEAYSQECVRFGRRLRVHLALDTGMSRLGFLCTGAHFAAGVEEAAQACALPNLEAEGVYTHFAVSDLPGAENEAYTREQFRVFLAATEALRARGFALPLRHCANSGAVLHYPEFALDMVRPGILLYGYGDAENRLGLKPCMRFVSKITTVKEYDAGTAVSYGRRFTAEKPVRIGVVGAGYADGLPRILSNRCAFAVGGGFAPQRGSICMDMCMIDLTELPACGEGDEVELFGPANPLEPLAETAQTISYELLCAVSRRVPRVYKNFSNDPVPTRD